MSFRLASYAVCEHEGRVLLVHDRASDHWTLPGGGVEHGEDPIDTVIRELAEETGLVGRPRQLLGLDSRVIPASERLRPGPEHHNVGVFYEVEVVPTLQLTTADPEIVDARWIAGDQVAQMRRSSLVDIGLNLNRLRPAEGHVASIPIGGLLEH